MRHKESYPVAPLERAKTMPKELEHPGLSCRHSPVFFHMYCSFPWFLGDLPTTCFHECLLALNNSNSKKNAQTEPPPLLLADLNSIFVALLQRKISPVWSKDGRIGDGPRSQHRGLLSCLLKTIGAIPIGCHKIYAGLRLPIGCHIMPVFHFYWNIPWRIKELELISLGKHKATKMPTTF